MPLWGFLLFWSAILSLPVILVLVVGRRKVNVTAGCTALAISFACASAYMLWRLEWFDVWRHGILPVSRIVIYGCYAAAYGVIGWYLAKAIVGQRTTAESRQRTYRF